MKALVQVSGGLDSAAALLFANEVHICHAVLYNYGQPYWEAERQAAYHLTRRFKIPLDIISIPVPQVTLEFAVKEYFPMRNLVLTAHSVSMAVSMGFDRVVVGSKTHTVRAGDPYSFRDSSYQFFDSFNETVGRGCEPDAAPVQIWMPLVGWSKRDVLYYLRQHNVDPDSLWTCYGPGPKPCGICYHCQEYQKAKAELSNEMHNR